MRPSLRFLALAVLGWGTVRAATLDMLPGAELFQIDRSEARYPPPVAATEFPPIEPIQPAQPSAAAIDYAPAAMPYPTWPATQVQPVRVPIPYYYPASLAAPAPPRPAPLTAILPEPAPLFYSSLPVLDDSPLTRIAATSLPPLQSRVVTPAQSMPAAVAKQPALDRIQLSAWALLRSDRGAFSTQSLASGGQLGGSQAGARLSYNVNRLLAATLRTSSEVGRRGGEVAAGVRIQPVGGIPVWVTAERRQQIGRYGGGRNAFAIFAEGGLWDRPLPGRFSLNAYLQGGVVGFNRRDGFVDGGLTVTRPVYKQFSAGLGAWGGAQPGASRLDVGPRVSMKVRRNLGIHVDWRQRVAGNAQPGSGPAITLAGDF